MRNKLYKLFIHFGLLALVGGGGFFYYARQRAFDPTITPSTAEQSRGDRDDLKIYSDPVHHFRIGYPGYLTPVVSDAPNHREVTFTSEGDPWTIAISVSTTTAISARAWVGEYNRKNYTGSPPYTVRYRIERETAISGMQAIIVHPYSDFQGQLEEYIHDRSALVVRDGKLFTVSARATDPEKIWDTFKFEE